jgi:hypothetical protein
MRLRRFHEARLFITKRKLIAERAQLLFLGLLVLLVLLVLRPLLPSTSPSPPTTPG